MPDSLELPKTPSIFSSQCDVASGRYSPFIDAEEALFVNQTCVNLHRKNIVTCKDKHQNEFIDEVDGLALNIKLSSEIEQLPFYIPIYGKRIAQFPNISSDIPVVGITLRDILTSGITHKCGGLQEEKNIYFNTLISQAHCFRNTKVILFSSGPDTLIEWLWYKREACNFYEKVAKMGFYAMTGFNFSLFVGECAFSHTLNIKRSLYSTFEIEQSGLLSIPHIYSLSTHHLNRWIRWLSDNPTVSYFTVNCQLQISYADISIVINNVIAIFKALPNIHVILQGFRLDYLKEFGLYITRVHVADMFPLKKAQSYQKMFFNDDSFHFEYKYDKSCTMSDLIMHNFLERKKYVTALRELILKKEFDLLKVSA